MTQNHLFLRDEDSEKYVIKSLIGTGGMGKVYLAEDVRLKRTVALKAIEIHKNEKSSRASAMHEARVLARLNHPNIVQIFDVCQNENKLILVMEFVNGENLQQYCNNKFPSLIQKVSWLQQITSGLAAAHKEGVIHCDLKLSNILIKEDKQVKISDFGIAKLDTNTSLSQQRFGTRGIMSPEQMRGETIDYRSDLYSLGILAFVMFSGRTIQHNSLQVSTPPRITSLNALDIVPCIPTELANTINQLLEENRDDRPKNTRLVERKLKSILIYLTQSEIIEQETLPLLNQEKRNTLESEKQAKLPSLNKNKVTASLILLIIIFLYVNVDNINNALSSNSKLTIALHPKLTGGNKLPDIQKNLLISALDSATREMIINAKSMQLIPRREVDMLGDKISAIGKASGANEIISSHVDCNDIQCTVILSRLGGEQWSVISQKQWSIQIEDLPAIYQSTQRHFTALFPDSTDVYLAQRKVNDFDYSEYLHLYGNIVNEGKYSDELLNRTINLLQQSPALYSAYGLLRDISLDLYFELSDRIYLDKLQARLNSSPPEYRYSVFYSIDMFWLSMARNKIDAATQYIDDARSRGASKSVLLELAAYSFFEDSQILNAIEKYKAAFKLRPSSKLLYNLAICYWWSGDILPAIEALQKALKLNPQDYESSQQLASLYMLQGDLHSALQIYLEIVKKSTKSIDLNNLGLSYSLLGDNKTAQTYVRKAVEQNPLNSTWLLNLADIEFMLGQHKQAILNYKQVIHLLNDKSDINAWVEKAQAYAHIGMPEQAIIALNKAKVLAPKSAVVSFSAALIYSLLGEHISATVEVNRAIELGLGAIWFNLPWFDPLCSSNAFMKTMEHWENHQRCISVN